MVLHFISGLPCSGSTLLSGILKQNPEFHAGMSSPVGSLINCATLITSSAYLLSTGSSDSGPGIPIPPGRPGFN